MKKLLANMLAAGAIMGTSIVAHADEEGWQRVATDEYTVTGDVLVTYPRTLAGGGVKVCFSGVHHAYSVQMYEQDPANPDDKVAGVKWLKDSPHETQCLYWSKVNTEDGPEELYLELSKNNTTDDTMTIRWYD